MKTKFNIFLNESDTDPFYSHDLRIKKGYRPKYKSGLIAVRFQDDETYGEIDDKGDFTQNYQELFSENSDFIKFFEKKYNIKLSDYRKDEGIDDYFYYFKCKPGEEKQKIEEISKDSIVKVVDYVDTKGLENSEKLRNIGEELIDLSMDYDITNDIESKKIISETIEKLKKLL